MLRILISLMLLTLLAFASFHNGRKYTSNKETKLHEKNSSTRISKPPVARDYAGGLDQPVPGKKWRITVCTMIKNEESYILEWIEFHRLQGVDNFVLYEKESDDTTDIVPFLYDQAHLKNLITIYTAKFFRGMRKSQDSTAIDHEATQNYVIRHCHRRFGPKSQWMMLIDTDEFVYSPRFQSIYGYLNGNAQGSSYYVIPTVKFGTGGMLNDFTTKMTVDATKTTASIAHTKNDQGFADIPLVVERCNMRAPRLQFDADYKSLYNEHCVNKTFFEYYCGEGGEKSIFKPSTCDIPGIHTCETEIRGGRHFPNLDELRLDHHMLRTTQHVEDYAAFQTYKRDCLKFLDFIWFSAVRDDFKKEHFFDILYMSLSRFSRSSCD